MDEPPINHEEARLLAEVKAAESNLARCYLQLCEEVEVLRAYGNKDCTAMADADLASRRAKS